MPVTTHDKMHSGGVLIQRLGTSPRRTEPHRFDLSLETFGLSASDVEGPVWLSFPTGWAVEQVAVGRWHLYPFQVGIESGAYVKLRAHLATGAEVQILRSIPVVLDAQTTFDISRHPVPVRNSASELGDIDPDPTVVPETYASLPDVLQRILFHGLYRDIVYIRSDGEHRGGLCSGLARWAGLRALRGDERELGWPEARREVMTLHGRQLTDRVIGWSLFWFLRGSPGAAYRAARDDALETGRSTRALDIAVPRLWRRDLLSSLVGEGHTVVPYRIRQFGCQRAEVEVYDPNRAREPQDIQIDLMRNRYAYRNKVAFDDHDIGMLAVPHTAYARRGTAFLGVLCSLLWMLIRRLVRPNAAE